MSRVLRAVIPQRRALSRTSSPSSRRPRASLRDLKIENRPVFQEKLRELKEKRKWTHDEFIEKAKPFVLDEKTAVYDQIDR